MLRMVGRHGGDEHITHTVNGLGLGGAFRVKVKNQPPY
jgi:hypothetical protein